MDAYKWPNSAKAAVTFTVDNLGEAQQINSGTWPAEKPIGQDPSVREGLPRFLQIFKDCKVRGTFFFETWSAGIYPDAVKSVIDHGHELAWHGYKHEKWTTLSAEEEKALFKKSFAEAEKMGIKYKGFRPAGGLINERTYDLLHEHGVQYISPAAERAAVVHDIAVLPFRWKSIDATFYMPSFSPLRKLYYSQEEIFDPSVLKRRFLEILEETVVSNGYISFLFHPFLETSEERLAVMRDVVELVSQDPRVWCAPCSEVADWVLQHPEGVNSDPIWITDTW